AQRVNFFDDTDPIGATGNAITIPQGAIQMGNFIYRVTASSRTRLQIQWNMSVTSGSGNLSLASYQVQVSTTSRTSGFSTIATSQTGSLCITLNSSAAPRDTWIRLRCTGTGVNAGTNATVTATCQILDSDRDYNDLNSCAADATPLSPAVLAPILAVSRNVYIARNVTIVTVQDMDFGWMVAGQTKTIDPYGASAAQSLRFGVTAEPNATTGITFPLTCVLTRQGGSETITMNRNQVKRLVSDDALPPSGTPTQSTGPNLAPTDPTLSYNYQGTTPTNNAVSMRRADYWVGGSLTIPQGTVAGAYTGQYTVTITSYTL
ncbi:MAG: DUF4402 domain-containing protein, partial [Candidatus Kapabacteria bacterium]|nr:DUF4402 domain-containing protein [Candidatus Kapabacteria bacterium]